MVYYNEKPSTFEADVNGSTRYRFGIESYEHEDQGGTRTDWRCEEVTVFAPLSKNKFVRAVIDAKWGNGYEEKLINEYNSAQLGIITGDEAAAAVARYGQFLTERASLKAQVEDDCQEQGIF